MKLKRPPAFWWLGGYDHAPRKGLEAVNRHPVQTGAHKNLEMFGPAFHQAVGPPVGRGESSEGGRSCRGAMHGRKDDISLTMDSGGLLLLTITAGRFSSAPNTNSAAERPESSLGTARKPGTTHGRWRGQSGPARCAFSASFSRQ
jgi:hypothetical protein